jgi:hypothetical protein
LLAASKKKRKAAINPTRLNSPGRTSKKREKTVIKKRGVMARSFYGQRKEQIPPSNL